jgi:tetratricopeptide (TPR) repeat protein
VAWLYPFDRWGHAVNNLNAHPTPATCVECHNTWVAHIPGTANQYRRDDMLLGVTCERCHGPGREHVEYHRAHPNEEAHAIVHPGHLSRERSMDVCAQCHANPRPLGRPFSYRPGEPLDAFYQNLKAKNPEDDTTNQVRYLSESKCFQKSEMTCITFHDPHRPRSAQRGCLKCHTAASCTDQPRLPEAVRGDCVGCHMPPRVWMHVHFYTTPDDQYVPIGPRAEHRIAVYPEARKTVLLTWLRTQTDEKSRAEADRLAAQLGQHWLNEAEQRQRAYRFKAAIGACREALRVDPGPKTRARLQEAIARQAELDDLARTVARVDSREPGEAIRLFRKILEINPDDTHAHVELGTIYSMTGQREEAMTHLREIARCDPNDAHGVTILAWMTYAEGRATDAEALCKQGNQIDPSHFMNHYIWGLALSQQERWGDAEEQFRKTLLANPTYEGANQGLSEALRHQGQAVEAVRFARRAVHWGDPHNVEMLLTLADAYAAAKRGPDARRTLEEALKMAETNNPALVPTIRRRLRKLS